MLLLLSCMTPEPAPGTKQGTPACEVSTFYTDGDGDGWGGAAVEACAAPAGAAERAGDCDDARADVNPDAVEVCDGADNDCDGAADGAESADILTFYVDGDGDGWGGAAVAACAAPAGTAERGGDCDDGRADVSPDAAEVCDALDADEDCDGLADDADDSADASTRLTVYPDSDGDLHGDPAAPLAFCDPPAGTVAGGTDCDDGNALISPDMQESCDGVDNDCDGEVDEPDAFDAAVWYADADADGWGDPGTGVAACAAPAGTAERGGDCDDGRADVSPDAAEVCDALDADEDCDGLADDADDSVDGATFGAWYLDADGDGYGDAGAGVGACGLPAGHVADATDCDDGRAGVNPGAAEVCDVLDADEDCDGLSDDADSSVDSATFGVWYADADGDGYGDAGSATQACAPPAGYGTDTSDCDDGSAAVYPGAAEQCNGVDDDCAGAVDLSAPASCPDPASLALTEGSGLYGIPAAGYVLADEDNWASSYALIDALDDTLPTVSVGALMSDLNRDGDPITSGDVPRATGFSRGFVWNSGDVAVDYWLPQGITGTFDADPSGSVDGEQIVVVSWHYDTAAGGTSYDKGVRLSFVDVSSTADNDYRHVLLVKPTGTTASPSFEAVPVHAGGIAWVGDWLYVADTSYGLRVYDMNHILQVSTDTDTIGCNSSGVCRAYTYKYVLPEVTRYAVPGCGCGLTFSFVGYDQSSSPPSLVTGEYDSAAITGIVARWPLDPATGLLAGGGYTGASEAFVTQQDRVQGAASRGGEWWLSCSSQTSVYGRLYNASTAGSTGYTWVDGPEDLAIDPNNRRMWSLTEDVGDRWVFAVNLSSVGG